MIQFHLDVAAILGPIIGIVLPLLVAIVTRESTNSSVKAVLLAALALVTNLLTGVADALAHHTVYDLGQALILALGTFIVSVAMHYGLFKPTGVSDDLQQKVGPKDRNTVIAGREDYNQGV